MLTMSRCSKVVLIKMGFWVLANTGKRSGRFGADENCVKSSGCVSGGVSSVMVGTVYLHGYLRSTAFTHSGDHAARRSGPERP